MISLTTPLRQAAGALLAAALICAPTAATAAASSTPAAVAGVPAADDGSSAAWSMTPVITSTGEERTNFAYALDPGASVEDAVLVRNSGSSPLSLLVYGADAVTTGAGTLDIASAADTGTDVGEWIAPGTEAIEVPAGEQVRVPFTVTVPDNATPGDHAGALLTVLQEAGEAVSVDMRYATRVTVTVSGDLSAGLSLDGAALDVATGFWPWEPSTASVDYTARNTGNTRLTGPQLVEVQGVEVYSTADGSTGVPQLAELLPGAEVEVSAVVEGVSAWSPWVSASVSVAPSVLTTASGETPVVDQATADMGAVAVAPGWWVLLGALVLVAGSACAALVRVARRRRGAPTVAP